MKLDDHPTVRAYREKRDAVPKIATQWESSRLKQLALAAGADDVGLVDLDRPSFGDCRDDLLEVMPRARSVMVLAFRVNPGHVRSPAQSVTDFEFKQAWNRAARVGRQIATRFGAEGLPALNMPVGFPQELSRWPGRIWLTNEKAFAMEAGLGRMGYNRLVLHPRFGAFMVLGSVVLPVSCDAYDGPLDFNPCIACGLCVQVCPVGAVKRTDDFDMMACLTHNYRERMGGFQHWVEQIVESRSVADYRSRVDDTESVSMWQHLAIGAQNRCDRCMAVCPAGEEVIGEYLEDRKAYVKTYLKRFQLLPETIYAIRGSDADRHVRARFPAKRVKNVSNGIRPDTAERFLASLPLVFQQGPAEHLDAVYHFSFTGTEKLEGTVTIRKGALDVQEGLQGRADLHVTADSEAWIRFLAGDLSLPRALLTRRLRIKGAPRLMKAFAACFPS